MSIIFPRCLNDLLYIPAATIPSFSFADILFGETHPYSFPLSIIGIDSPSKIAYANSLRFKRKQIRRSRLRPSNFVIRILFC